MQTDTVEIERHPNSPARILALTGGIGSGKSSVRAMLQDLGVPCLDVDVIARNIHQNPRHPAMEAIAKAIPEAVTDEGTLRRGSLRQLFVHDSGANSALKRILKPYVIAEAERWTRAQTAPYVVWESALITAETIACERVLVSDMADDIRLTRLQARNPDWSDQQIRNIIAIQLSRV